MAIKMFPIRNSVVIRIMNIIIHMVSIESLSNNGKNERIFFHKYVFPFIRWAIYFCTVNKRKRLWHQKDNCISVVFCEFCVDRSKE